jgi:serine/threonine protein kinase
VQSLKNRLTDRKLIVRGDLASCYEARDARLERTVFLKVLNPALTADREICARFEREAKAAARLNHPNLVHVHEFGEDPDEGLYMIQEWITGRSLRAFIQDGKEYAQSQLLEIARQLLAGLQQLHQAGILHRDVKPENILIGDDGRVRITDFSLAVLQGGVKLTHHQAIVGTPAYMSPEQAAGRTPDARSDLYAVGIVLYELATGENPFAADDIIESLRLIREANLPIREKLSGKYSDELVALIESCLQKRPDERPASAAEALEMVGGEQQPVMSRARDRRQIRPAILTGGLILSIIVIVLVFRQFGTDDKPLSSNQSPNPTDTTNHSPVIAEKLNEDSLAKPSNSVHTDSIPVKPLTQAKRDTATARQVIPSPPPGSEDAALSTLALEPARPESVDVYLSCEPWAHVFMNEMNLGTTPFTKPIRLATGNVELTLRNTAFPMIRTKIQISDSTSRAHIRLADYVSTVDVTVEPWGEIYVDEEHIGTSPLSTPLFLSPGSHKLRIVHPALTTLVRNVQVSAGDTMRITVDLNKSEMAILSTQESKQ